MRLNFGLAGCRWCTPRRLRAQTGRLLHRPVRWSLALAPALLLSLACSSPAQPAGPAPSGADETPKSGGTLRMRERTYLPHLDLSYSSSSFAGIQGSLMYNGLLGYKTGPGMSHSDPTLKPELAERWEVSSDAKTFTFHLRKGVKFANLPPVNGREFTSADVKFSLEYLGRTGEVKDVKLRPFRYSYTVEGLEAVETPDRYTAVVKFSSPFVPFLSHAATRRVPMLARDIYDADGNYEQRAVGTGPWQWDASTSQTGTRMVWKKNPDYWDSGRPYIDEVRWLVIPSDGAQEAAFKANQLDYMREIENPADYDRLVRENPKAVGFQFIAEEPWKLVWNSSRPPLTDIRVRRAIALSVDRDEMIKTLGAGVGRWALSGALPGAFSDEEIKRMVRYDPAEARRLLKEAGFESGLALEHLEDASAMEGVRGSLVQLFQAQMKRVGIDVQLKIEERTLVNQKRQQGDFGLGITALGLVAPDSDNLLFRLYHHTSTNSSKVANDPKLDQILEATRAEPDPAKRDQLARQAVTYLNDQAWAVSFFWGPLGDIWQPHLKGHYPHSNNDGHVGPNAWLDQ